MLQTIQPMFPYLLCFGIGYILAKLFQRPIVSPFFEDVVMKNVKLGKKVIIAIDNDATIFEMIENRIRITRGTSTYTEETVVEPVTPQLTGEVPGPNETIQ